MNPDLAENHHRRAWQPKGLVYLWRYTENERNFPGWHLSADEQGCASLLALLDEAADAEAGWFRTVPITPPTPAQLRAPNNRGGLAAWQAPAKLRFARDEDPAAWIFPADMNPARITLGVDWFPALRDAISGIPVGRGDFAIGAAEQSQNRVWVWWSVDAPPS